MQVRDQSKELAKTIRDRVHGADENQLKQHEKIRNKRENKYKSLALCKLKSDFNYLVQDVGSGYSVASFQVKYYTYFNVVIYIFFVLYSLIQI